MRFYIMGKLIVIEGLDGSGKKTQSKILSQNLNNNFYGSKCISFPDYNQDSSALVKMYLNSEFGSNPSDVNAYAASSFYAVDRFASYKKTWQKDYEAGKIIIADTTNELEKLQNIEFIRTNHSKAMLMYDKLSEDCKAYLSWSRS